MRYSKYQINVNDTPFPEILGTLFSLGKLVIVGMRREESKLSVDEFRNAVERIGSSRFYERFPLFLMPIVDLAKFLDKWHLIKAFFVTTFVFLLVDVEPGESEDLDALYESYFNTRQRDSLVNVANKIWEEPVREKFKRRLHQSPCLIVVSSMENFGLAGLCKETLDSAGWNELTQYLDEELQVS